MYSGSFGVRSIVLCKCSGKYIDIYFKLKITFLISELVFFSTFPPSAMLYSKFHCTY